MMAKSTKITPWKYPYPVWPSCRITWAVTVRCIIDCSPRSLTSPQDGGTRGSVARGEQLASRLQSGPRSAPWGARGSAGGSAKYPAFHPLLVVGGGGGTQELTGGTSPAPPCGQHHTLHPPLDLAQSPEGKSHGETWLRGETVKVKVKGTIIFFISQKKVYMGSKGCTLCSMERQHELYISPSNPVKTSWVGVLMEVCEKSLWGKYRWENIQQMYFLKLKQNIKLPNTCIFDILHTWLYHKHFILLLRICGLEWQK